MINPHNSTVEILRGAVDSCSAVQEEVYLVSWFTESVGSSKEFSSDIINLSNSTAERLNTAGGSYSAGHEEMIHWTHDIY
jgi:hypothetical protein